MVINPIVGVYILVIRIPIKGGMTIPNITTFDHGTYEGERFVCVRKCYDWRPLKRVGDGTGMKRCQVR